MKPPLNYFDIETVPQPKAQVERMMPVEILKPVLPPHLEKPMMPEFTNAALKDPDKIEAWLAGKIEKWKQQCDYDRSDFFQKALDARMAFHENAALSAATGRIAVISIGVGNKTTIGVCTDVKDISKVKAPSAAMVSKYPDEKSLLTAFVHALDTTINAEPDQRWVGFCTQLFDIPFILQRCFMLGVNIGDSLAHWARDRYCRWHIDLQQYWLAHKYGVVISQDSLCKILGMETKPDDGAFFWKLLNEQPQRAIEYAFHDIHTIRQFAKRMQLQAEEAKQ
jgi:hypothetical protein